MTTVSNPPLGKDQGYVSGKAVHVADSFPLGCPFDFVQGFGSPGVWHRLRYA
jgi:hypothetical protein